MSKFSLRRVSDGAGDSGQMSLVFNPSKGIHEREYGRAPEVGKCVRVGSFYGRTMNHTDWWQTTPVSEIISDTYDPREDVRTVKFKTVNGSEYVWKEF